MKIFVNGASGKVSQNVIQELLEAGHEVFAGTRFPEKGEKKTGVTWVVSDASAPEKGLEVLEKVDAAFFIAPPGFTNQYEILSPWIEKAKQVKLKKVVLMTAMGVEFAPDEAPFRKTEILLEKSGLNWNIIRPNWFMQNFHTFWIAGILSDKKIYFPAGNAKTSFIDSRDISSTAAKLLVSGDKFASQAFVLTGTKSLTHDEVASIISKHTGLKIEYVNVSPEDFKKGLLSGGVPEDYASFLVIIAGALRDGHSEAITDSVQKITGKSPISFDKYAEDNKNAWLVS
ncbi:NAD(P)-dependent oxidoreductase [Leptospira kobayashii]|uniref:NAD(P)-dependent oxidoreductase n=1 Tax=Leptospira kobayashii TaxID=1917830 RepID=A0ABN6KAF0_9LEPT|nr:NAD(P)H-binding protein [Leptospira kobayashii]BDA77536.1 NAD(P)-dependent oxidoreductase [Leptospira kobayashii]